MAAPDELNHQVGELSQILLSDDTIDGFLEKVTHLTVAHVPACDTCSVSIRDDGGVHTRAASDPVAMRVDQHQYANEEGPCIEAISTGRTVRVGLMAEEKRWPRFSPLAESEGVVSTYSVPLTVDDVAAGALNIYSLSKSFEAGDEEVGEAFAAQAAAAVSNASAYYRALALGKQLEEALQSRDVIGQAKGIIMERERVTADRAFELLRSRSHAKNMKLRDVAEQVVRTGALDGVGE